MKLKTTKPICVQIGTQRQTKLYRCVACGQTYLHDDAHNHIQHQCKERPVARLQAWLESGKRYEPTPERTR